MEKLPVYKVENFSCNTDKSDFYVNTFKEHIKLHGFVDQPHRHDSYLLVFFTNGTGIHDIDFDQFKISPGSLFVLQPGQMHFWNLSEDIEGYIVIFSPAIYNLYFGQKKTTDYAYYQLVNNDPYVYFEPNNRQEIIAYFDLLVSESRRENKFRMDKMLNLLDTIHIEIARKFNENVLYKKHSYNLKINTFEIILESNFKSRKLPSYYAEELNITLKHLNRICNVILQKTVTEVISDRIILEVKRMLVDKNLSINQIATELGYEDYSYFSRFFKNKTGYSPTTFRTLKGIQ